MARSIKTVYWDACSWISLIQDEIVTLPSGAIEKRGQMCRAVLAAAESKKIEIFTSAFALAEVNKFSPNGSINSTDKLKAFFENDYFVIVDLSRFAGEFARDLMQAAHAGLKPADATHLASAAISDVDFMHTFDEKLLKLDNKINKLDGTKLRITKPELGNAPVPLLELASSPVEDEIVADAPSDDSDDEKVSREISLSEEEIEQLNASLEEANLADELLEQGRPLGGGKDG